MRRRGRPTSDLAVDRKFSQSLPVAITPRSAAGRFMDTGRILHGRRTKNITYSTHLFDTFLNLGFSPC